MLRDWSPTEYPEHPALTHLDPDIMGKAAESVYYRVLYELLSGEESRFAPYLGMFPSLGEYQRYWVTYWDEEVIAEWTKGSAHAKYTLDRQLALNNRLLGQGRLVCRVYGYDASPMMRRVLCDQSLLHWAHIAYVTRSWSLGAEDCFIPYADMFNHGGLDNSLFQYQDAACIASTRAHAAGEEFTQTYRKDLTFGDFFLMNGFVSESGVIPVPGSSLWSSAHSGDLSSHARREVQRLECERVLREARWRYLPEVVGAGGEEGGQAVCELPLPVMQCYRLMALGQSARDSKRAAGSYRRATSTNGSAVVWVGNWSSGVVHPREYWEESRRDIPVWEAVYRDIQSLLSRIPTSEPQDWELYTAGTSKPLRSIGYLRLVERRAVSYCMSAVHYRLQWLAGAEQGDTAPTPTRRRKKRRSIDRDNDAHRGGEGGKVGVGRRSGKRREL